MSKLLFNTQPLVIEPELALLIGLNESIILQQIHYWIEINRKSDRNFRDGYHWTYNSYEAWREQFPFWSIETIKRTITKLENSGPLVSNNFNKAAWDRTKWYRIDYHTLETLKNQPLGQNDLIDKVNMTRPIPETIQKGILTPIMDDSRLYNILGGRIS